MANIYSPTASGFDPRELDEYHDSFDNTPKKQDKVDEYKALKELRGEVELKKAQLADANRALWEEEQRKHQKKKKLKKAKKERDSAKLELKYAKQIYKLQKKLIQQKDDYEFKLLAQRSYYQNHLMAVIAASQFPESRKKWEEFCATATSNFITSCTEQVVISNG